MGGMAHGLGTDGGILGDAEGVRGEICAAWSGQTLAERGGDGNVRIKVHA